MEEQVGTKAEGVLDYRCFGCVCRGVEDLLTAYPSEGDTRRAVMADVARLYAEAGGDITYAEFLRDVYRVVACRYPRMHPFWWYKRQMNEKALEAYSLLKSRRGGAQSVFSYGLRTALAGSGIDFLGQSVAEILHTVDDLVGAQLAIDHGGLLQQRLARARHVLYLANMAGEVVFDRFFIKGCFADSEVSYVVNCSYAGYSASGQDADYVDMRGVAQVLANGCDAPASIPLRLSARAWEAYQRADVIVAKGTLNFTSFFPLHDERLFALMRVHCPVLSAQLGCPEGSYVVVNAEERVREMRACGGRGKQDTRNA